MSSEAHVTPLFDHRGVMVGHVVLVDSRVRRFITSAPPPGERHKGLHWHTTEASEEACGRCG